MKEPKAVYMMQWWSRIGKEWVESGMFDRKKDADRLMKMHKTDLPHLKYRVRKYVPVGSRKGGE